MFDRGNTTAPGARGLDFMVDDEGIIEQFIPQLVNNTEQIVRIGQAIHLVKFNPQFWRAYFDAYNSKEDGEKLAFLESSLGIEKGQANMADWEVFDEWVRKNVIGFRLTVVLKNSINGQLNTLNPQNSEAGVSAFEIF